MEDVSGRAAAFKEAARICRIYSDWCANWGLDRNMHVATEAAQECATLLDRLPADLVLPADDDAAGLLLHAYTDEGREIARQAMTRDRSL